MGDLCMKRDKSKSKEDILLDILKNRYSMSAEEIKKEMKLSEPEVKRLLKKLEVRGVIEIDNYADRSIAKILPFKGKVNNRGKDRYSNTYI